MISTLGFGAVLTSAKVNEIINAVNGVAGLFTKKSGDESVTSTTALQNDDDLHLTLEASSVYLFIVLERIDATAASDYKSQFSLPSGTTTVSALNSVALSDTVWKLFDLNSTSTQQTEGAGAGSVRDALRFGLIITSSTPGDATLQWAQQTSGGTATILKANSFFWALKVAA